ncbi:MAG: glycosyltransferase [Dehalococcoidales bacterium]|jgi:GT2 family glycosyltransferase
MSDAKRVGVAISTWNRAVDLKRCLTLLYNQSFPFDIFVVDNCSLDWTEEVLKSFGLRKGIEYYIMPHSDFSAIETINVALRNLNNEYVIILDDDTFLTDNNSIEKMVSTADTDTNIAIVACNIRDKFGKISFILKTPMFDAIDYDQVTNKPIFDIDDFSGACALFRKSLVGPDYYDESFKLYWNEPELAIRMAAKGHRVVINQSIVVTHGSEVGRESCKSYYYGSRNTFRLMTKVMTRKQSLLYTAVLVPFHFRHYIKFYKNKNFFKYLPKLIFSYLQGFYRCIFAERIQFKDPDTEQRVRDTYNKYYLKEILFAVS